MRRLALLMFGLALWCGTMLSQGVQIKGKVTSAEDGSALPGASVIVKGTNVATVTDVDGNYSITAPAGSTTVSISFIGMKPMEIEIAGQTNINAVLEPDVKSLEEVVVTAMGIKKAEKSLGYSVTTVKSDETVQKSEPDLLKTLQGKVPGVDIRSSQGAPGSATRITMRGTSSFYGESQPLIVVDGMPYSNNQVTTSEQTSSGGAYQTGLASLDPNDIETISVLKGSSAAALYGSKAANGVIYITTKSGSGGQGKKGFEVTYSGSYSWENVANLPDYQNTYGNGANFIYSNANGSWGPRFDSMDSIPVWGPYKAAFPEMFSDSVAYVAQPNNVKNLFKTGTIQEHSINFNGGNDRSNYSVTMSVLNQDGYIPYSGFDRYNLGAGGRTKLENGIGVAANFSYSKTGQTGGFYGENQIADAASSFARTLFLGRTWNMDLPYETADGLPVSTSPSQYDNPLWSWKHNTITTETNRIIGNVSLDYSFFEWLSANYQIGINHYDLFRREVTDIGSRSANGEGRIMEDNYYTEEIESKFLLNFNRNITDEISLKVTAGHVVNQSKSDDQTYKGQTMISPGLYDINNTKSVVSDYSYKDKMRMWSIIGDITVGYKEYAFITLSGRNDHSSTLPSSKNSYFYPSVSGSFVFSDAFELNKEILTLGKVRLGWAQTGNDADPYKLENAFVKNDPFRNVPRLSNPSISGNKNLKNESTSEIEFGTQLEFFNQRFGIDFTYYDKTSKDLIAEVYVPRSSGFEKLIDNIGEMNNKGIELGITIVPIKIGDLKWEIYSSFSKNKNEVVSLTNGVERLPLFNTNQDGFDPYIEPGYSVGYFRGTKPLFDKGTGLLVVNPQTGFPFTAIDESFIGDPHPDYKTSLTNTITFKGLTLSCLFDYTKGGDFYSVTINSLLGRGVTKDTEDREKSWIIPGVYGKRDGTVFKDKSGNPIRNVTRVSTNELYFSGGGTETTFAINGASYYSVYDATVFRLRELSLSYELPRNWLKSFKVGSVVLSLTGRNLWYFAPNVPKYTNFDPEVNAFGSTNVQGIDLSCAPTTRRYGVNVKITF